MAILTLAMVVPVVAQVPAVGDILRTARYVATLQQHDLKGQIRKGNVKTPVMLYLRGENIQFQYLRRQTNKWAPFHMRLEKDHYDLFEMKDGKTLRFPASKLGQAIEGTDLSYEDLAMRFLYWPKGKVEGSEKIKGRDCWKVRLENPGKSGRYAVVYVWVDKKAGALIQVVGYNGGNPAMLLKRFLVSEIMKVGNAYTLRTMRVDSYDPVTNKTTGITYVEFEKPKPVGPKGLQR